MSPAATSTPSTTPRRALLADPGYQAFVILRTAFTVAPILFGLDKFANLLVDWPAYLAPWIQRPRSRQRPDRHVRRGCDRDRGRRRCVPRASLRRLVGGLLAGIIVNLLTIPDYFDIALRDFGLLLAAIALARLAERYHGKRSH